MFVIYDQDYDYCNIIHHTDDEDLAKRYCELMGLNYVEINKLPKEEEWPERHNVFISLARISSGRIVKTTHSKPILKYKSKDAEPFFKYGEEINLKSIWYKSAVSEDDSKEKLDEILSKFKIVHRPTDNGYIESEFIKND